MPVATPGAYYLGSEIAHPLVLPHTDRATVMAQVEQFVRAERPPGAPVNVFVEESPDVYRDGADAAELSLKQSAAQLTIVRPEHDQFIRVIVADADVFGRGIHTISTLKASPSWTLNSAAPRRARL